MVSSSIQVMQEVVESQRTLLRTCVRVRIALPVQLLLVFAACVEHIPDKSAWASVAPRKASHVFDHIQLEEHQILHFA